MIKIQIDVLERNITIVMTDENQVSMETVMPWKTAVTIGDELYSPARFVKELCEQDERKTKT